jgi:hypothetical protein
MRFEFAARVARETAQQRAQIFRPAFAEESEQTIQLRGGQS